MRRPEMEQGRALARSSLLLDRSWPESPPKRTTIAEEPKKSPVHQSTGLFVPTMRSFLAIDFNRQIENPAFGEACFVDRASRTRLDIGRKRRIKFGETHSSVRGDMKLKRR